MDCPACWKFRYLDKLPSRGSAALVFGSAWHGAVEAFVSQQAHEKSLADLWGEHWAKQMEKEGATIDWGVETPEQHFNVGMTWATAKIASDNSHANMEEFLSTLSPLRKEDGAPVIEQKIELRVPGVPVPVIGYIDIVTADGVPGDFKTSSKSWGDDKAAGGLQPLFYLAALNQAGVIVPGNRFRHYVFVKNKTPKVQVIEHSHNLKEMFFLFQVIKNIWQAIEAGAFPENPTTWRCNVNYCDFFTNCRGKFL